MASPPKPWETSGGGTSSHPMSSETSSSIPPANTNTNAALSSPSIPNRPTSLMRQNQFGTGYNSGYNSYGTGYGTGYGAGYGTGYGSTGYGTGYGASRYGGGYGGGMYGGGMYGGGMYGSGMYGHGMYGGTGGMYGNRFGNPRGMGPPFGENGEMSFMQQMEASTQSTFQILDQIVQAFTGFSQMLESTFFATHSSFMAMMGVADQFGQLRGYMGQVFSMISLYNSAKSLLYRMTGQRPPIDPSQLTADSFQEEMKPKPSKKPLLFFLALVVGLPYLMTKLINHIQKNKPAIKGPGIVSPSDISNLEFCKAQYDFLSDTPGDLPFRKGDLVAILSKLEPESEWWQGRTQEGRIGVFPKSYVSLIPRKTPNLETPSSVAGTVNEAANLDAAFQKPNK